MRFRRLAWLVAAFVIAGLVPASPALAATLSGACSGNVAGDFNGDTWADLAVGVPNEDVGGAGNAGGVDVFYGSDAGLSNDEEDPQFFTQNTTGIPGGAEAGDQFGGCVVAGDFDGDTFDDLAISAPGESVTSDRGAFDETGAIHILYGGDNGLSANGPPVNQLIHQDNARVPGVNEDGDEFGAALASGDLNGDERDDLAVGAPLEDVGGASEAGSFWVFEGSGSGLTTKGSTIWHEDTPEISGKAEGGDRFATSLAAGDFDGNGREDLAVGVPGEDVGAALGAGAVHLFLSGGNGTTASRDRVWHQDSTGLIGTAEDDDQFGAAVAIGDFDGDGLEDLVVGVPSEDGGEIDEGVIQVLYGTETGPTASGDQMFDASDAGGTPMEDALFGSSLTTGDVNQDAAEEVAVGAPGETVATFANAGAVYVFPGDDGFGLGIAGQTINQNTTDVEETAAENDFFGLSLTNGDYNNDEQSDLSVGVPGEDLGEESNAGAVNVLYADASSTAVEFDTALDDVLTQADGDDSEEGGDAFGFSLG